MDEGVVDTGGRRSLSRSLVGDTDRQRPSMTRACVAVVAALLAVASGQIAFGGDGPARQLVENCGVAQPSNIFPTVVGGVDVNQELGRWPWVALVGEGTDGRRSWPCGGTLISARTVLTVAHCVVGRQPSDLKVRLGEYDLSTTRDGSHTDVSVSTITIHPDYHRNHNDIALLRLSRPVQFSRRIQPVCLPAVDADHTGKTVDLAGWGKTGFNGEFSSVLQEVKLTVVDERECEQSYRKLRIFERNFPGGFQGTKICANEADGASKVVCGGDSGGPLMYRTTGGNGRHQVIGLVSYGIGCGNPEYPGIYAKVSKYIPWIIENSV